MSLFTINRLAVAHAAKDPQTHDYTLAARTGKPWRPHEWVLRAMTEAYEKGRAEGLRHGASRELVHAHRIIRERTAELQRLIDRPRNPPRGAKDTYDLAQNKSELEDQVHDFLRSRGWDYTSTTPTCHWLWTKTLADGKVYVVDEAMALRMEEDADSDAMLDEPVDDVDGGKE